MKLVSLDTLKLALGIEDDSEDDALEAWEARATAWVESQTGRTFGQPDERIEYMFGSGTRTLFLNGHISDPDEEIAIRERSLGFPWEDVDTDAYERRGDSVIRVDGGYWLRNVEYELTYEDGYEDVPGDIADLVIEIVGGARDALIASTSGTSGLIEEEIDGYRYKLDSSAVSSSSAFSAGSVSATGQATLGRWKRMLV